MTIGIRRFGVLAVAVTMAIAACSSAATTPPAASSASSGGPAAGGSFAPPACVSGTITAVGSTALQPLVDAAGKAYVAACPGATVTVNGGG